MKLTAENFQSWARFSIPFDKMTVIVGPSDVGKSAITRAFYGVVRNEIDEDQIQVGSDETKVTLTTDDNVPIIISRNRKTSARYLINGKPYKNGGRSAVPDDVAKLNMGEVLIGSSSIDPIFSGQHDQKFMLQGTSPQQLNAIFGAFSSTEKLERGKREVTDKILEGTREAKLLSKTISETERRKDSLVAQVSSLTPIVTSAEGLLEAVEDLGRRLYAAMEAKKQALEASRVRKAYESLTIPSSKASEGLLERLGLLSNLRVSRGRQSRLSSVLRSLSITVVDQVKSSYNSWVYLCRVRDLRSSRLLQYKRCQAVLDSNLYQIAAGEMFLATKLMTLETLESLCDIRCKMGEGQIMLASVTQELGDVSSEISDVEKSIADEERQKELITCPRCGEKFRKGSEHGDV